MERVPKAPEFSYPTYLVYARGSQRWDPMI